MTVSIVCGETAQSKTVARREPATAVIPPKP
jgi:hypothetical protein